MIYTTAAALLLASVASVGAQLGQEAYIASVCSPTNSSGGIDFDAPCNAVCVVGMICEVLND